MFIDPTRDVEAGEGHGLLGDRRLAPARFLVPSSAVNLEILRGSHAY